MANRNAELADLVLYPDCSPAMKVGDVIWDSPTTDYGDGHPRVLFTDVANQFPDTVLGGNIWIDGDLLPTPCLVGSHANGEQNEWTITDSGNYSRIQAITGTQVRVVRTANSSASHRFLFQSLKYYIIRGESDAYPGMRDGIHAGLAGTFGLWACEDAADIAVSPVLLSGGHGFSTSMIDGGHLIMEGIEVSGCFSGLRNNGGAFDWNLRLTIRRCYLHDGESGEGFYLGRTGGPPLSKYVKLEIEDCLVVRRPAEALQLQHLIDSLGDAAVVRNLCMWQCDMDYLNAFQGGQDTGIQYDCNQGNNTLKKCLIGGAASVGINKFSSGVTGAAGDAPVGIPGGQPIRIQDCLFYDCRGILTFAQNSTIHGNRWVMENIYALNFNDTYYQDGLNTYQDYYIGQNGTTDKHQFMGFYHDGVKPRIFENRDDFDYETSDFVNVASLSLPAPEFVNTGIHESIRWWVNWKAQYGNYHDIANGTYVFYRAGIIACNIENGVEYAFYKCLNDHTSTGIRPRLDPTNWVKITWDSAWVRSDQVGHNPLSAQSLYPPTDFRLVANNFWNKKGWGLFDNQKNTDWTHHTWYRSNSSDGSNRKRIPWPNLITYIPQDCDAGKYIAREDIRVNAVGTTGQPTMTEWRLVSP